jgi:hypothetical protein
MRVLNETIGIFSVVVSLFVMMATMLVVGVVGEAVSALFEKIRNYELPKQQFKSLLRDFISHSKPAYY